MGVQQREAATLATPAAGVDEVDVAERGGRVHRRVAHDHGADTGHLVAEQLVDAVARPLGLIDQALAGAGGQRGVFDGLDPQRNSFAPRERPGAAKKPSPTGENPSDDLIANLV